MYDIIDVPLDVAEYADDISRRGVKTVIRYYNHRNSSRLPSKRLEPHEATALERAGLSLAVVFQQRGGASGHIEDLDAQSGRADAQRALELSNNIGQPNGSAIYFAVDHDYFRQSEIQQIVPYFEEIKRALDANFRVGVYGSGTIGRAMLDRQLADLVWLAGAAGWSGTRDMLSTDDWAMFQKYPHKTWPGGAFQYDGNIVSPAHADFGQFRTSGQVGEPSSASVVLMEVTARSGLKIRKGPGVEFSDVSSLPLGSIVSALGKLGHWVQVDVEGDGNADGFMYGNFLTPVSGGFPVNQNFEIPLAVARSELALGVREVSGSRHNPRIVMYHATTRGGVAPDETAWCSSFVNYCVEQTGLEGTNSKSAMSWHDSAWGSESTTVPREGDIAVFRRREGSSNGSVIGGHVGFWLGSEDGFITLLGGNQSNAVTISKYPMNGLRAGTHYELLSVRRP